MTIIAFGIVFTAAFLHAGWNYLLKKGKKKILFIWWYLLVALIIYFPMFIHYWSQVTISSVGWYCVIATSLLHGLSFWLLGNAYERGDLSLVYPLSRGSGPLFVVLFSVSFINEQLSGSGVLGIVLVVAGIYIIHLLSFSYLSFLEPIKAFRGSTSLWALGTGLSIAAYSLVDKIGVMEIHPNVYIYMMILGTWIVVSIYALPKNWISLKEEWFINKRNVIVVGLLAPFANTMLLYALRMTKVSYVFAIHEVSIVFSVIYGLFFLGEKYGNQKFLGAFLIALGVGLISLGG